MPPTRGAAAPRVRQLAKAPGLASAAPGPVLSVQEVAARLGRTERAVRHMVARRTIPFRKVGARVVFFEHEIARWLLDAPGVSPEEALGNLRERRG